MGTASMYGNHILDAELDCPWMTLDVKIEYLIIEEGVEILSVQAYGVEISNWLNMDYIFDLVGEEISNADYHHSDHGDKV